SLLRGGSDSRLTAQAAAVADARIAEVQVWPEYAMLDTIFDTYDVDTPAPGWKRVTVVRRFGGTGDSTDVVRVTVTVTAPGLALPVSRSITIASAF
ncbi:MAG: hypothetical protein M3N43_09085, partial [Actinomycetota bacterium]|nr:hypothetical protein [Actinomycetota bacterium]